MPKNINPILIGVGIIFAAGFLLRKQAAAAVEAVANVNQGTPFEGGGVVGTIGNVTNQASGGILGRIGRSIGDFLDPINRRTLEELTNPDG